MNKYLSNKITFFSFWLIILVVLLHSLNVQFNECNNLLCGLQYLLSYKLAQIAVPLFFFISGYLYFFKADLKKKIDLPFFFVNNKKRIKTVLIPYVLWCVIWFFILYLLQLLPFLKNYFSEPLHSMTFTDKLLNLFVYPVNYPFWFLRELMLLFVISPLVFLLIKYLKVIYIVVLFALIIVFSTLVSVYDITLLQSMPVFYFSSGAFISLNKIDIASRLSSFKSFGLLFIWILFNVISIYFDQDFSSEDIYLRSFNVIKDIVGCVAVWYMYDFFNHKVQWKNYSFYQYSFFIFAFHGIPTVILVKLSQIFKNNEYLTFLAYVSIVILIVLISIFIGNLIKKSMPQVYRLLTGNR